MKIPAGKKDEREKFYQDVIERCMGSRQDRKDRYDILKRWYLYGRNDTEDPVDYNKLYAHLDLLASYLFSGETTNFIIEIPDDVEKQFYDFELRKAEKLRPKINDVWHDSNADIVFNDALLWALVYDTCFVKFVPLGKREFASYVVEPHACGVLREDVSTLDHQEAFVHEFFMSESNLMRRICHMSEAHQAKFLSRLEMMENNPNDSNTMPSGAKALIINATTPSLTGNLNNADLQYTFNPRITERGVRCCELWIYDDDLKDYRTVTMLDGEVLLHDAEKNAFVAGELPFVKITPTTHYDYFWGRSELLPLIPLQRWLNDRIPQIKRMMAKQAQPPVEMTGYSGITEEKFAAFMQAGGFFTDPNPATMGRIQEFKPDMSSDIFKEIQMIEQMFNEMSGIREIMKGGGESGVRAMGHADLLARLGSSRAKKKAYILEDAVEKCAHLILKCIKKYDDTTYKTEETDIRFIAAQLTDTAMVKVDAHSSSPVFMEAQMDKASMLFEAGAMDKEDLIDATKYPNAGLLKVKLRKREKAEAAAQAAQQQAEMQAEQQKQGGQNAAPKTQ